MALVWNSSSSVTRFVLQRAAAAGGAWETVADPVTRRWYVDRGLEPGTEYRYRVLSRGLAGDAAGGEVTVSTEATPWQGDGQAAAGVSPPGLPSSPYACDFLADGRMLLGGSFPAAEGEYRANLSMHLPDGSLDPAFDPGSGPSSTVRAIQVQADGKILIGGSFTGYAGTPRAALARIHADGTLDTAFTPVLERNGFSAVIYDIDLFADGRILVAGYFTDLNGESAEGVTVLLPDGQRDPAWLLTDEISSSTQLRATALPGGRVMVFGENDFAETYFASPLVLRRDGSLDADFMTAMDLLNVAPTCVAADALGRIYLGGSFTANLPGQPGALIRVFPDGTHDPGFGPTSLLRTSTSYAAVHQVAVMKDGKLLVYGDFVKAGDTVTGGIARLMPDGSPDTTFRGQPVTDTRFAFSSLRDPERIVVDPANRAWIVGMGESATGMPKPPALLCLDTSASPPATPADGSADPARSGGIELTWTVPAGAYGTRIEGRPAGAEEWTLLADLPAPADHWLHQVSPGEAWEYRLSAWNKAADSSAGDAMATAAYDPARLWAATQGVADLSDLEIDTDGDGVPLLVEYALGGSAQGVGDPQPEPWLMFDRLYLLYPRLRADLSYVVEQSTDGLDWSAEGVSQGPPGASAFASVPAAGRPRAFLRLRVEPR